jgi:plasmid stabilization system protein ParE
MPYKLTRFALDDLDTILCELAEQHGWGYSMRTEEKLFEAFELIAITPGIGHLRRDLLPREVYFYFAKPYLVLYRRDVTPVIGAIVHGARDIAALMLDRTI